MYQTDNVFVGDCLWHLASLCGARRVVMITDSNVGALYPSIFEHYPTIVMAAGEANKNLETYHDICCQLIELGADRHTLLVGVGGGVVTDMTGFVGATFMRGVAFGFVATTLMAQVDASIGGKNGLDVQSYKNIVGTFAQAEFVLCDPLFLSTLPDDERSAGYGEVIKYALMTDLSLLDERDKIARCVDIKLSIVRADFKEAGARKLLNLGHTFAHAIEKCSTKYTHGQAVGIGLCMAAKMSVNMGFMHADQHQTVVEIVGRYNLPTMAQNVDLNLIIAAMAHDKKGVANGIEMVLLGGIGHPFVHFVAFESLLDSYDGNGCESHH